MPIFRTILLFSGLLLSALAYGYSDGTSLSEMPPDITAPDFALQDIDGNTHRLSDYKGKVVIINFWATWCPPCREEMPAMQRAWDIIRKEDMVMLGINLGEDEDSIFAFTANYPVEFPLLMDEDSSVTRDWPVSGLPTTYIVAPDGKVVFRAVGGRAWDAPEILDRLRTLQKHDT